MKPAFPRAGLYALAANLTWGFFPLYFHQFVGISSWDVLAHRAVWSLAAVVGLVAWRGQLRQGWALVRNPRRAGWFLLSGLLVGGNWVGFIWASTHGQALQSGLGYYINPLVSVALGALFLKERMTLRQGLAIGLVCAGVLVLVVWQGRVPWIALFLAVSFALYGLVRKQAPAESLQGLFAETLLMAPFAIPYLLWLGESGQGAFLHQGLRIDFLLVMAGVLTAIPLLLFGHAARNLRLSTLGLLFYVNPSLQFLLAVFVLGETFTPTHAVAFVLIWTALGLYSWEAWKKSRG